eukprot:5545409-Pyramimonas_sp.AAC.1
MRLPNPSYAPPPPPPPRHPHTPGSSARTPRHALLSSLGEPKRTRTDTPWTSPRICSAQDAEADPP